jgi:hypothetical protein
MTNMQWSKHGKPATSPSGKPKERRLTITITPEAEKVFTLFREHYKSDGVVFTDTAILTTFLEAGIRSFVQEELLKDTTPVPQDE